MRAELREEGVVVGHLPSSSDGGRQWAEVAFSSASLVIPLLLPVALRYQLGEVLLAYCRHSRC
jgi:hypothetical protein